MKGWLFSVLVATGSIFALLGLQQFFIDPLSAGAASVANITWFALQVAPLLIPLIGTLRRNIRATFVLCLASLLYFAHGVVVAYVGQHRLIGVLEIVFALTLCLATTMLVRALAAGETNTPS